MMQLYSPETCIFHNELHVQSYFWKLCIISSYYNYCWWGNIWVFTLALICWAVGAVFSCLVFFAFFLACKYQVMWCFFPCPLSLGLSTSITILCDSIVTCDIIDFLDYSGCLFWLCVHCCLSVMMREEQCESFPSLLF